MARLNISPEFFKAEIRDGFPIGELMKRNWAAQLQVLQDVKEMCEKYNIKWFAYAGTHLGAVRHKGFIPWDDDIDICMLGEDYIKFLYYATDELKDRYKQISAYSWGDWDQRAITRIVNATNMEFNAERLDEWHNCPFGVGTDIFPFYYIPRDKEKEEFILDLLEKIDALMGVSSYQIDLIKQGRKDEADELNEIITSSIIGLQEDTGFEFTAEKTLTNQLSMLYDQVCRFTAEDEADYVTIYPFYETNKEWKIPKEKFASSCMLPFEMIEIPVMEDYDFFCRHMYGENYMTPVRGGAAHDYPYFSNRIRMLENKLEREDLVNRLHVDDSLSLVFPEKEGIKKNGENKCKVLYYTGVREMMIYGEYVIDKIRDIFKYFEQNKDHLTLKWCPGMFYSSDKKVIDYDRLVPELKKDYEALIEEYRNSGIGELDESGNPETEIEGCDIFYGDESLLSDFFAHTGKPVYIQDYHTRFAGDELEDFPIKESGLFGDIANPEFEDAVYLEGGKGYAFAKNMNAFYKVDKENETCEFIKFFSNEIPDGQYLYTAIKKVNEGLLLIPGAAKNAVLFNPEKSIYREYDVSVDTLSNWHDFVKYADFIENDGKWYFIGERYTHILKLNPKTGEKELIDTGHEETVWLRHGAMREGGLVKIVASNTTELLTFNLRTEKLFVKKTYNTKEMVPKLQKIADEIPNLIDVKLNLEGNLDEYIGAVFESYSKNDKGFIIKENEDWISFAEAIKYVIWQKTGVK